MAKAAPYRLTWIPEQKIYALHDNSRELLLSMTQDSQEWFALLANIPSFSFCGQHGQLTVRRETRPSGGGYWYAYRRSGKRMVKKYLGRTLELSLGHLESVAHEITISSTFYSTLEPPARYPLLEPTSQSLQGDLSYPASSNMSVAIQSSPKSKPVWKMPSFLTP